MDLHEKDASRHDHEHGEDAHATHGTTNRDIESGFQCSAGIVLDHCSLEGPGLSSVTALTNNHAVRINLKRKAIF